MSLSPAVAPSPEGEPPTRPAFWAETPIPSWWSRWHLLELLTVFVIGASMMNFLFGRAAVAEGVSGHDSWYHVKMGELLPEIGAAKDFPWLRFVWFREHSDEFVSHHFGFHVILVPFIQAARLIGLPATAGGRWAISFFFALSLTLFTILLMMERVRLRWLWLGLYFLMPFDFFYRHGFVRAIAPSLAFMLLILALMFRRRYFWAGLAVAAYNQLYLGGVLFGPVLVICFFVAGLIGSRGDRVSWRLPFWTLLGWGAGLLLYPYSDGVFEFLRLQVFGSGLSPEISVGREWKPYEGVWDLLCDAAPVLIPQGIAVALRLRLGPRLNPRELAVLLASLVFGVLMLKSRRFVEYWPPFGLLSAALLMNPLVTAWIAGLARWRWSQVVGLAAVVTVAVAVVVLLHTAQYDVPDVIRNHRRLWMWVAGLYVLTPLSASWVAGCSRPNNRVLRVLEVWAVPVAAAVCLCLLWVALREAFGPAADHEPLLIVPVWAFALLATTFVLAGSLPVLRASRETSASLWRRLSSLGLIAFTAVLVTVSFTAMAGAQIAHVQRSLRPKFNLAEIRPVMDAIREVSEPGDVIFTDDWDIFPVYFYVNSFNHYIVGLDPEFTHHRDPILWERYKRISRGRVPSTYEVGEESTSSKGTPKEIRIRLQDIRDEFGARFVIVDDDHKALRSRLDAADEFCERIYPATEPNSEQATMKSRREPPYVAYRVFSEEEQAAAELQKRDAYRRRMLDRARKRNTGNAATQPDAQHATNGDNA